MHISLLTPPSSPRGGSWEHWHHSDRFHTSKFMLQDKSQISLKLCSIKCIAARLKIAQRKFWTNWSANNCESLIAKQPDDLEAYIRDELYSSISYAINCDRLVISLHPNHRTAAEAHRSASRCRYPKVLFMAAKSNDFLGQENITSPNNRVLVAEWNRKAQKHSTRKNEFAKL